MLRKKKTASSKMDVVVVVVLRKEIRKSEEYSFESILSAVFLIEEKKDKSNSLEMDHVNTVTVILFVRFMLA